MTAKIPREKLLLLAEQIKNTVDLDTLKEGLDYFKKACVKSVKVYDSTVSAQVREPYNLYFASKAIINSEDISQNTCSCSSGRFCVHMAAAFFYLYTGYQWPDFFLDECKKRWDNEIADQLAQLTPAVTKSHPLMPEEPVEAWYSYFEREYNLLSVSPASFKNRLDFEFFLMLNFPKIFQAYTDRIFAYSVGWPDKLRQQFRFHAVLFVLTQVEKANLAQNQYYQPFYFDYCERELLQLMPKSLTIEDREKCRPLLQKALEVMRSFLLQGSGTVYDWLRIYRTGWDDYLYHPALLEEECVLLKEKFREKLPVYSRAGLGLAHLSVLEKKDKEALNILAKIDNLKIADMISYLHGFSIAGEWNRLLAWLRWLSTLAAQANPGEFEEICRIWVKAAGECGAHDELNMVLKKWLPRSYWIYAETLLKANMYKEWVDVTLCQCQDYQRIPTGQLRHLEAKAPLMLLPLYHQWAVQCIEGKNRKSYQAAVKILKALSKLYKKLKLGREWNEFVRRLVEQYPRYRAFHEELQKGKLIS